MRARGLRGTVGGSLELTIFSTGIAIEIDIALESFELGYLSHETHAAALAAAGFVNVAQLSITINTAPINLCIVWCIYH